MKTFKQYIEESKYDDDGTLKNMTPDRAVKWLEKTRKSINNHMMRNSSVHSYRASELRMRYDDYRDFLRKKHPKHWEAYCKKNDWHIDHSGMDVFA